MQDTMFSKLRSRKILLQWRTFWPKLLYNIGHIFTSHPSTMELREKSLTRSFPLGVSGILIRSCRPTLSIRSFPRFLEAFHAGGCPFRSADFHALLLRGKVVLVALAAVERESPAGVGFLVVVPTGEHSAA